MYIEPNDIDPEYRSRLWRHMTVLIALESGSDLPEDQVIAAIVFLQGHLAMLLEMTPSGNVREG